ncbi:hypothetical protein D8911_11570 [Levilactobacillus brevis]|nr:hypothetical protein D8911_11570 [Levilactobacillus brevis]
MKFEDALKALRQGLAVKRNCWKNFCLANIDGVIINITLEELQDPDGEAVLDEHQDEGLLLESGDILAQDWEGVIDEQTTLSVLPR